MARGQSWARWLCTALVAAGVAGCGGGGDDDAAPPPSISVQYTPSSIAVATRVGFEKRVDIEARLGSIPTGPVFPVVVVDSAAFSTGSTPITENTGGRYAASLTTSPGLAAGTYGGTLRLRLCRDAACASEYALTGATLPYSVVIEPTRTASVVGVGASVVTATSQPDVYRVLPGSTVLVTTNVAATFRQGSSITGNTVTTTATTATSWSGRVDGSSGGFVGLLIESQAADNNSLQVLFELQ